MKRVVSGLALLFLCILIALTWQLLHRPSAPPLTFSVLAIGWDGSRLQKIEKLLAEGQLPNLKKFIAEGTFVRVKITDGRTDTKAGWTQIFTGYNADVTGVYSNREYQPIPLGFTLFERLKKAHGERIRTLFISGKVNNIGARGPHKVCINCRSRFADTHGKTQWWDESKEPPIKNGHKRIYEERLGEPYFNALPSIDVYKNALQQSANVLAVAKQQLLLAQAQRFFAFVHFEEPDEQGHLYSESSKEYDQALINNDKNLGELLAFVAQIPDLRIFILSDHGFDEGEHGHKYAEDTFWAANSKKLKPAADRRDFTPTLLELYGFSLKSVEPSLDGRSLLQ